MRITYYHFIKACWGYKQKNICFLNAFDGHWYKYNNETYYDDSKSLQRKIIFAFHDFEAYMNIPKNTPSKDINILVKCAYKDFIAGRKEVTHVGVKSIIEDLLH